MMKSEVKLLNPQCQYFVVRKKRLCRMTVRPGRNYCGEHEPQPRDEHGQDDTRVPCPNDPKHTCYASKLEKHLSICNARQTEQPPYIVHNINATTDDDSGGPGAEPRRTLSQVPEDELMRVIDKINCLYDKYVEDQIATLAEDPIHPSMVNEWSAPDRAQSSLRHLRQASALMRIMERHGLVQPDTCYVELGAGKGQLSYYVGVAWCGAGSNSHVVVVDRAALRHKRDNKLRTTSAASTTANTTPAAATANTAATTTTVAATATSETATTSAVSTNTASSTTAVTTPNSTTAVTTESSTISSNTTNFTTAVTSTTAATSETATTTVPVDTATTAATSTTSSISTTAMTNGASTTAATVATSVTTAACTTATTATTATRIRADLAHLMLSRVPAVQERRHVVGFAKHLCGVATDLALRCITSSDVSMKTRGFVIATCCHHRCEPNMFLGRKPLQEVGVTDADLEVMLGIVSWATCGDGRSRTYTKDDEQHDDRASRSARAAVGFRAKALLDWSRARALSASATATAHRNMRVNIVRFVPATVSPENIAIVAVADT